MTHAAAMTHRADAQGHSVASRIAGIVLAVLGGLVWLLPAAEFVFIVPKFVQVFVELEVALPAMARLLIGASGVVAPYWPIFAAPLAAVTMGLVVGSVAGKTRLPVGLSVAFSVISLLLVIVVQALLVMGLFLPLVGVVEAMG